MVHRLYLIVLILFILELGLFLVVLPWSSLWERNYFLYRYPGLAPWLLNHYLRGAITGLGFADIAAALWQATHFRQLLAASSSPPPP
ncbi:MAG: hypothetical protein ACE5MH_02000 [Terriglobia bacterium]